MSEDTYKKRENKLFVILAGLFIANALIAECVGVKIFSFEKFIGSDPANLTIFGQSGLSFNMTAGVILWPVVFIMTDIINEYYGTKGVKFLSYLASGIITYAFLMFYIALSLPPADFWIGTGVEKGVPDMNLAFSSIFGQGLWIILGSITAFLIGQVLDVFVFHQIKKVTGEKMIWLRATGSTLVSQLIDSFVVLFIAFYIGANWSLAFVLAVCAVNYIYKFTAAVVLTPVIYLVHGMIEKYLGHELADKMKKDALLSE